MKIYLIKNKRNKNIKSFACSKYQTLGSFSMIIFHSERAYQSQLSNLVLTYDYYNIAYVTASLLHFCNFLGSIFNDFENLFRNSLPYQSLTTKISWCKMFAISLFILERYRTSNLGSLHFCRTRGSPDIVRDLSDYGFLV